MMWFNAITEGVQWFALFVLMWRVGQLQQQITSIRITQRAIGTIEDAYRKAMKLK